MFMLLAPSASLAFVRQYLLVRALSPLSILIKFVQESAKFVAAET